MKKRHMELREDMLQELAEEYAINNNRDATKVIKEIIATEQIKKTYRNIRYALGKQRNSSLLRLLVPLNTLSGKEKTTKVLSTKQEIHDSIIDYNIKHYSKAEASPVGIDTTLAHKVHDLALAGRHVAGGVRLSRLGLGSDAALRPPLSGGPP